MSGDTKKDDNRPTSIPTPVLEYYKNYSLNKQLSKYFTGTSVSYIPEIVQSNDDDDDFQSVQDIQEEVEQQPAIPSPTSSVATNRKLEWDNGADIGYNNCNKQVKLHKSSSLPILKSLETQKCNRSGSTSSSSSVSLPIRTIIDESSSTSSNSQKSNILMDLKRKIGTPDAESTPKDVPIKTNRLQKRCVRLCLTKPVVIDCIGSIDPKIDRNIQTSPEIKTNSSKIVQTGDSLMKQSKIESNQSVIIIDCSSNSDKSSIASSFEYLSGSNRTETNSNNLSDLLQKNQSNYLITDIERSIDLLQRLLRSKRYDPTTKKRYIKRIVEKILKSNYIDDNQQKLDDDNVPPQYPALTIKTFNNEYLPKSLDRETKKRSIFTTNQPSPDSYESWKADQTRSEQRLLENCNKGQGDSLVNYATKERQYQLQWINDEICHLGKLKALLEKNQQIDNKPQTTTTVYMMSEDTKQSKKYVIETDLESSSNSSTNQATVGNNRIKTTKKRQPSLIGNGVYQLPRQQYSINIPLEQQKQILNERICDILKQFEKICGSSGKSTTSRSCGSSGSGSRNKECLCENKSVQVDDCGCTSAAVQTDLRTPSTSDSATITTSSSTSSLTLESCNCCRGRFDKLYTTKKKLPTVRLCRPCYLQLIQHPQQSQFYNDPNYCCKCYTTVKTGTLQEIRETVDELHQLDYCTCHNNSNNNNNDDEYCAYCRCKLKKTTHNRNSVAYMLTFENTTIPNCHQQQTRPPLAEIKVKIPTIRENKKKKKQRPTSTCYNLQDYLVKNRPKFVQLAELRRQTVINTRLQREQQQDVKKLLFLQNNPSQQQQQQRYEQRLFSTKEMKETTKRNYRKLPEVQQKFVVQRENQIRQANRLITDIFNRKLKENVLKGKLDFPSDLYVVNL